MLMVAVLCSNRRLCLSIVDVKIPYFGSMFPPTALLCDGASHFSLVIKGFLLPLIGGKSF